jgi:hypothetical protein
LPCGPHSPCKCRNHQSFALSCQQAPGDCKLSGEGEHSWGQW